MVGSNMQISLLGSQLCIWRIGWRIKLVFTVNLCASAGEKEVALAQTWGAFPKVCT